MKSVAVFVATTGGPVRVERITRERAPQSMVCLKRSSTVLPISASYDSFVRPGSGVIDRIFGPFEDGAFRLDVSAPIETGESWQLGFFVAHALCAPQGDGALASEDDAEAVAWLTGHVDYDLAVGSVGHIAEKVHASRTAISGWLAAGRPVSMFVRDGADLEAALAAGLPEGVRMVAVCSAMDALAGLGLAVPGAAVARPMNPLAARRSLGSVVPVRWLAGAFAATALAAVALSQWPPALFPPKPAEEPISPSPPASAAVPAPPTPAQRAVPETSVATEIIVPPPPAPSAVQAAPVRPKPIAQAEAPAPAASSDAASSEIAAPRTVSLPAPATRLAVFERRAPAGRSCAEVQFGAAAAMEVPVPAAGATLTTSAIQGLCGLAVAVDNGSQPSFVAVTLDVISGRLLYGTVRPDLFAGRTSFGGRHEWAIDLPRRLSGPFEIKVTAVSGPHAVAAEADWLKAQSDETAAATELSAKGLTLSLVRHRVTP